MYILNIVADKLVFIKVLYWIIRQ